MKNYTKEEIRERGKQVVYSCKNKAKIYAKKGAKNIENCVYTTVGTVAILCDKLKYRKNKCSFIELQ